jgi:hypothetical protein
MVEVKSVDGIPHTPASPNRTKTPGSISKRAVFARVEDFTRKDQKGRQGKSSNNGNRPDSAPSSEQEILAS